MAKDYEKLRKLKIAKEIIDCSTDIISYSYQGHTGEDFREMAVERTDKALGRLRELQPPQGFPNGGIVPKDGAEIIPLHTGEHILSAEDVARMTTKRHYG